MKKVKPTIQEEAFPLAWPAGWVRQKVQEALDLLRRISPTLADQGFCGPLGRVVTAWQGRGTGVQITGKFSQTTTTNSRRYALTFTLETHPNADALSILKAATLIAELQQEAPQFIEDESPEVLAALGRAFLDGEFGQAKSK